MSEKSSSECGNELPKGLPLGRGKPTFEEECTERIKTATKNSQDEQWAYFLRGMSYFNADIQHLNEPNNHNTYVAQAIDDYAKSYEINSDISLRHSITYFAYQVNCIFQDENRVEAFKIFQDLLWHIIHIKKEIFKRLDGEIIHYTPQEACSALLLDKEPFRSYNTEGMDDTNEGKAFFEVMKQLGFPDLKNILYRSNDNLSPAYAASFAKPKINDAIARCMEEKYGPVRMTFKHDAEFAPTVPGFVAPPVSEMFLEHGLEIRPETHLPLYKIFYVGDDKNSTGKLRLLMDFLCSLGKSLHCFRGFYEEFSKNSGTREPLIRLVQELLDEIRFLFKSNDWKDQKEVRVLQMRYDQNSDDIRTDCEKGRKYLDALRELSCTEVGLAPKVKNPDEYTEQLRQANPGLVVRKI